MTILRQYPILLLASLGFVTCIGCTNSGFLPWKSTSPDSAESGLATTGKSDGELPPKEAARACLVAAERMQNGGQVQQAILLYEKARKNDPGLKSIAHRLAVLYDIQGDSQRSLSEYKLAVEAEPKNADVASDLGYYYFERNNLGDAERELRRALEIDPKHTKGLTNLGMVLAAEKHFDESFQIFSRAVGPAAAHSNLGVLLAKQGATTRPARSFTRPWPSTRRSSNRRPSWNILTAGALSPGFILRAAENDTNPKRKRGSQVCPGGPSPATQSCPTLRLSLISSERSMPAFLPGNSLDLRRKSAPRTNGGEISCVLCG